MADVHMVGMEEETASASESVKEQEPSSASSSSAMASESAGGGQLEPEESTAMIGDDKFYTDAKDYWDSVNSVQGGLDCGVI